MDHKKLKELWKKEEAMDFSGWDFSHLEHRWEQEKLPWSYVKSIHTYLKLLKKVEPFNKLIGSTFSKIISILGS